jgi:hypothetical protein
MATILIQNENWVFDDGGTGYHPPDSEFYGYYVPQTEVSDLTINTNYISSNNVNGYIIEAGDEGVASTNNYFDGALVRNNYIKWNGTLAIGIITHGLFFGYQLDVEFKYNYLDNVPMGIIRKSNGMTDTAGVVAYNIIVNGAPGVVCKGMNGVRIYNNTFYSDHSSTTCNRAMIELYYNDSIGVSATSENCKIKNNIFYSVENSIRFISVDAYSTTGFECDYNIYWCENSVNNEPIFSYHGSTYSWTQWRALGYDAHSVIMNPRFTSTTNTYDPSTGRGDFGFIPAYRLNYGVNLGLGLLVSHGLDFENVWSTSTSDGSLKTQIQDSNWQVGAYVLRTGNDIGGDWYLAPWGSDTLGDGSFNNPYFTLDKVWPYLSPGDTVYLRGGTYINTARQDLTGIDGTINNPINIWAYPNETPIFTDDGIATYGTWPASYIYFSGDYFHWRGIEWSHIEQRPGPTGGGWCLWVNSCNYNTFELLNFHHCSAAFSLYGNSTGNLILNCDSHHNQDPYSVLPYEHADGISVHYITEGCSNIMRGCRMWWNCDDGLDMTQSNGYLLIENCWAWYNGYIPDTFTAVGNGMGFKLGNTTNDYSTTFLRTVRNNIAFYNRRSGFDQNEANCKMYVYNNIAYYNRNSPTGSGFMFYWYDLAHIFRNNISFDNRDENYYGAHTNAIIDHNSYDDQWQPTGPVITTADFVSIDANQLEAPRQYDGNLPILNFLHLAPSSGLIGAGIDVGIDTDGDGKYWNTIPSLGAFEYVEQLPGYYVAPFGSDVSGTGTFSNPYATLQEAWDNHAAAGATIYMRGGLYEIDSYQRIDLADGTSGNTIKIYNYPGEKPTIVPSSSYPETSTDGGIYCYQVDYIHIRGIELAHFVQNRYGGYDSDYYWGGRNSLQFYQCNYCIAELIDAHHGMFGITINGLGSTGNLLLNCDAHDNHDPYTCGYEYGGVDGITIRVETPGTYHTMRGCRMWNNSDDGVDLWASTGLIIIDKCWSWHNGYREDGVTIGGDGGGFKLGPVVNDPYTGYENQHLRTITNNIAFNNRGNGFVQNAAYCIIHFYNNTAYLNNLNGVVLNNLNTLYHIVRNNLCYKNYGTTDGSRGYVSSVATTDHNTFLYTGAVNSAYTVTDADFSSLDASVLGGERQSDGSLPLLTFLHLASGSDLIHGGVDVDLLEDGDGNPWNPYTPSLGAFEYIPESSGGIIGLSSGVSLVMGGLEGTGRLSGAIAGDTTTWAFLGSAGVFSGHSDGHASVYGLLTEWSEFVPGVMRYTDYWPASQLKDYSSYPAQEHITVGSNYISCRNLSISQLRIVIQGSESEIHELSNMANTWVAGGEYSKINAWARYKGGQVSYDVALPTNCYDNPSFIYTAPANTLKGLSDFAGYYHYENTRPTYWGSPHSSSYQVSTTQEIRGGLQRGRMCPILGSDAEDETYWGRVKVQAWLKVNAGSYSLIGTSDYVNLSEPTGASATLLYTMGTHGETGGNTYTLCLRPVYMDSDGSTPLAVCEGGVEIITYTMI